MNTKVSYGAFGSVSRVATSITPQMRAKYEKEKWCVHPNNDITRSAIMDHLAGKCSVSDCTGSIFHVGREVSVIHVQFEIVLYLRKNKASCSYDFDAYHKERPDRPWTLWKQNMKTPPQILGARFQGMNKTTKLNRVA